MTAERLEIGIGEGIVACAHDLDAAGAVGVNDGRDFFVSMRLRMRRQHHVVVGVVVGIGGAGQQFEIFLRRCKRRHRRQRANGLSVFDALVEPLARAGVAGIRQDRAMAERAGTGFGRALIERDHAVSRDHERHQIGDRFETFGRRDIADAL